MAKYAENGSILETQEANYQTIGDIVKFFGDQFISIEIDNKDIFKINYFDHRRVQRYHTINIRFENWFIKQDFGEPFKNKKVFYFSVIQNWEYFSQKHTKID